jgi:hypothetical protein
MDNRDEFIETWLTEMPNGIGAFASYAELVQNIQDRIEHGANPKILSNGLHILETEKTAIYWYEDIKSIILGVILDKKPQSLVVQLTGKNPNYKGKPPFASDLYNDIIKLSNSSIRLLSDIKLSDEGYNIWKKLFNSGNKVTVYDKQNPGQTFKTFDSIEDMDNFFKKNNEKYERYQFVLSEKGPMLAETRGAFNIRRYRELTGLL